MKRTSIIGYCELADTDCHIEVAISDNSGLENPRQKIEVGRISCKYAKLLNCNPRNCPVLKSNNMSF